LHWPRRDAFPAERHASSLVVMTVPGGVPPTLTNTPSRRRNRSRAALISRPAASRSLLSATTQLALSGVATLGAKREAAAAAGPEQVLAAIRSGGREQAAAGG